MNESLVVSLTLFVGLLIGLALPLGRALSVLATAPVDRSLTIPGFCRFEASLIAMIGAKAKHEMTWYEYVIAVLVVTVGGALTTYIAIRLQPSLGFNPLDLPAMSPDLALNTAVSFATNTNWQAYAGESTLSYAVQAGALTVQNFISAATGISVAFALCRGLAAHECSTLGNFWRDMVRICVYILLPASLIFAIFLVAQGVVQNVNEVVPFVPLESLQSGIQGEPSRLVGGPAASQVAIKILGTNGGGFFNANAAHPWENPGPLANFISVLGILVLSAALCTCFGAIIGDRRQGHALLLTMTGFYVVAVIALAGAESQPPAWLSGLGVGPNELGSLEGKEVRFAGTPTALFTVATTAASCGAVNAMHDSLLPLSSLVPLTLMALGEVIFGGVGAGLCGMLMLVILSVFIAGLLVGKTPEYLGKKIGVTELKLLAMMILVPPTLVLTASAWALHSEAGLAGLAIQGPHGLTQVVYAFSSAVNNNGSAFGGLSANSPFYNYTLAACMWLGRFAAIVPALALALKSNSIRIALSTVLYLKIGL